jgi:hypothetical protein
MRQSHNNTAGADWLDILAMMQELLAAAQQGRYASGSHKITLVDQDICTQTFDK